MTPRLRPSLTTVMVRCNALASPAVMIALSRRRSLLRWPQNRRCRFTRRRRALPRGPQPRQPALRSGRRRSPWSRRAIAGGCLHARRRDAARSGGGPSQPRKRAAVRRPRTQCTARGREAAGGPPWSCADAARRLPWGARGLSLSLSLSQAAAGAAPGIRSSDGACGAAPRQPPPAGSATPSHCQGGRAPAGSLAPMVRPGRGGRARAGGRCPRAVGSCPGQAASADLFR